MASRRARGRPLRRRKPTSALIEATDDTRELYRQIRDGEREMYFAARRVEFLKSKMQVAIGTNRGITGLATWDWRDRWALDIKALATDDEELYARLFDTYKRNTGSRTLRLEQVDLTES